MKNEWKPVGLSDVADVAWGDTKVTKKSYVACGYPAFSATGQDGFLPYFDYEGPGVVVSAIGAQCGKSWYAHGAWSCIKNTIRILPKVGVSDARFLFYSIQARNFFPVRGSAQPFIAQEDARRASLRLPPLPVQRRIAAVLGAMDDLIEANERVILGLELTVNAVFEREGFDVPGDTRLGEVIAVNPPTASPRGEAPYIDMASLPTNKSSIRSAGRRQAKGGARFLNGDALVARITPCLENGKAAYVDCLASDEVGVGSTEFLVLRGAAASGRWAYSLTRSGRFRSYAISRMNGTSGRQRVGADSIAAYPIAIPGEDALGRFERIADPAFKTIRALTLEIESLRTARDDLLPLLMSGRISPGEVDLGV